MSAGAGENRVGAARLERRDRSELTPAEAAAFLDHLRRYVDYPPALAEADLARADHVWWAEAPDGALIATTAIARVPLGTAGVGLYTYMVSTHPAWRRQALLHRFAVRSWLAERRRSWAPTWWLFLAGSPSGYLTMARNLRGGWPRQDAAPTPRERAAAEAALAWLAPAQVRREAEVIRVVDGFGVSDPAQDDVAAHGGPHARYFEAVNPDWRAGSDLLCVAELTLGGMLGIAGEGLLRVMRRALAWAGVRTGPVHNPR